MIGPNHARNSFRTSYAKTLLSLVIALSTLSTTFGQANDKLLLGGVHYLKDVLQHSGINYGVGVTGQFQYPITSRLAVTAKAGFEMYTITSLFIVPTTSLGYGYNPISGYGFNTIQNSFYTYPVNAKGYNIPLSVGPRVYLTKQLHLDLYVGADIAASKTMMSTFHLEPVLGYMLPIGAGRVLDLNTGFVTNFIKGSSLLTVGAAYGLRLPGR